MCTDSYKVGSTSIDYSAAPQYIAVTQSYIPGSSTTPLAQDQNVSSTYMYAPPYTTTAYDSDSPEYISPVTNSSETQLVDGPQWNLMEPVDNASTTCLPATCSGQDMSGYGTAPSSYQTALPYRMTPEVSPYSMSALQSSLPPPERRLPIPSLQIATGMPTSDALRKSLSNSYSQQGWSTSPETYARRQSSIHDLAHVSSMMQPVTRLPDSSVCTSPQDGSGLGYTFADRGNHDLTYNMTSGPPQSYTGGTIFLH